MKHKIFCIGYIIMMLLFATAMHAFAQDERTAPDDEMAQPTMRRPPMPDKGQYRQNIFAGGDLTVAFGTGFTTLGASPMIGFVLNDYVDAGVVLKYIYSSTKGLYDGEKIRQHTYGPGAFVRAYPVPMIFAQAQLEENFITQKYISANGSGTVTRSAPSLLLGGGYAGGRQRGGTSFYTIAILADVLRNANSPYVDVDYYNNGARRVRISPVIRAGFNLGLFQRRYHHYYDQY